MNSPGQMRLTGGHLKVTEGVVALDANLAMAIKHHAETGSQSLYELITLWG